MVAMSLGNVKNITASELDTLTPVSAIRFYDYFTHKKDIQTIEKLEKCLLENGTLYINLNCGGDLPEDAKQVLFDYNEVQDLFNNFHIKITDAHRYDKSPFFRLSLRLRKKSQNYSPLTIVFLATKHEIESGRLDLCLSKYFDKEDTQSIYVFSDQECTIKDSSKLNIDHQIIGISDFNNIYKRSPEELGSMKIKDIPPMGGSSGPNYLFFGMVDFFKDKQAHKNLLVLECDTRPIIDGWLEELTKISNENDFMILGSTYKGTQEMPQYQDWTGHLNGVGIFRNNEYLHFLSRHTQQLILEKIRVNKNHFHSDTSIQLMSLKHAFYISYDVGMHLMKHTKLGQDKFCDRDQPNGHFVDSPFFVNASTPQDSHLGLEHFKENFPDAIILHQKYEN